MGSKKFLILLPLLSSLTFLSLGSIAHATPNNFPHNYTSTTPVPSGSDFTAKADDKNAAYYGATATITNSGGGPFYIYCNDGSFGGSGVANDEGGCDNKALGNTADWQDRGNGDLGSQNHFEVILPLSTLKSGMDGVVDPTDVDYNKYGGQYNGKHYLDVSIVNACYPIKDSFGWEDHLARTPANSEPEVSGNGIDFIQAGVKGQINVKGYNLCNGVQDKHDLQMRVYETSFVNDSAKLGAIGGSPLYVAEIVVEEINPPGANEKNFTLSADPGTFVGPADVNSLTGLAAFPDGENFTPGGFVNLQNPEADYCFQGLRSGALPAVGSCASDPTTRNINRHPDPTEDYFFHFSPDCNAISGNLEWRNAGNNGTNQPGDQTWKLYYFNASGNKVIVDQRGDNFISANNNTPLSEKLDPNISYIWEWDNVYRSHGVSVKLPFSEVTSQFRQCLDWNLTGSSVVNVNNGPKSSTVNVLSKKTPAGGNAADTAKFYHSVHNSGPDDATYDWYIEGSYNGNSFDITRCGNNTTNEPTITNDNGVGAGQSCPTQVGRLEYWTNENTNAGGSTIDEGESYQFPSNANPGDTYCERIVYTDAKGPKTASAPSAKACAAYKQIALSVDACHSLTVTDPSNLPYHLTFTGSDGSIKYTNDLTGSRTWNNTFEDFRDPSIGGNTPLTILTPNSSGDSAVLWPQWTYRVDLDGPTGTLTVYDSDNINHNGGPCMSVSCNVGLNTSPASVEPDEQTTVTYGVTINNYSEGTYGDPYDVNLAGSGGITFNGAPAPPPPIIVTASKDGAGNPVPENVTKSVQATLNYTGTLTARLTWYNGGDLSGVVGGPCSQNITPSTRATMRVTSGDIATGGGFGNSSGDCSATALFSNGKNRYTSPSTTTDKNAGGLRTFAVPNAGKGSGGDFAAYALGYIDGSPSGPNGFYTAAAATSNNTYNALMFANTEPGNLGGLLGGDFTDAHCAPDYFDSTITTPHSSMPDPPGGAKTNVTSLNTKQYYHNGDLELKGGNINAGVRPTLYVDGNVTITGDITYSPWQFDTTNYNNNAPYFTLIVRGNIYVDSSVGEINGLYIAQPNAPDGTDGSFVSCSNGSAFPNSGFIGSSCQSQLNVKGSVIAQHVYALRAKDTLSQYANTSSASEIFDYLPSIVVGQPNFSPSTGGAGVPSSLENLTNLPPVF